MLTIISDLHLTDGTSGETVDATAFRAFGDRLRDLAYDASKTLDGYKPIESMDLVLLGDILDVIRSTTWLKSSARPWDKDVHSKGFVEQVKSVTNRIIDKNKDSLGILKDLSKGKLVTLPPASKGKPKDVHWEPDDAERQPVKVRIHYLVGNHDWFFHLPGPDYDSMRRTIVETIGAVTPWHTPFPWNPADPAESVGLEQIYNDHRVFARHGDVFDPANCGPHRDSSSIGDAVVIELVDQFGAKVHQQLGPRLPSTCAAGLKEIDNLRPLLIIPAWIDGLLLKTCPDVRLQKEIKNIWDGLVDAFLKVDFVQEHADKCPFNSIKELETGLKFSKRVFRGNFTRLYAWLIERFAAQDASYYRHACAENAFKSRQAHHIVYGHTHRYEVVPLESTTTPNGILDQVYFNSGTWRPYHELVRPHPETEQFVGYQLLTYLAFFKNGECEGRPFQTWSGYVGLS